MHLFPGRTSYGTLGPPAEKPSPIDLIIVGAVLGAALVLVGISIGALIWR